MLAPFSKAALNGVWESSNRIQYIAGTRHIEWVDGERVADVVLDGEGGGESRTWHGSGYLHTVLRAVDNFAHTVEFDGVPILFASDRWMDSVKISVGDTTEEARDTEEAAGNCYAFITESFYRSSMDGLKPGEIQQGWLYCRELLLARLDGSLGTIGGNSGGSPPRINMKRTGHGGILWRQTFPVEDNEWKFHWGDNLVRTFPLEYDTSKPYSNGRYRLFRTGDLSADPVYLYYYDKLAMEAVNPFVYSDYSAFYHSRYSRYALLGLEDAYHFFYDGNRIFVVENEGWRSPSVGAAWAVLFVRSGESAILYCTETQTAAGFIRGQKLWEGTYHALPVSCDPDVGRVYVQDTELTVLVFDDNYGMMKFNSNFQRIS